MVERNISRYQLQQDNNTYILKTSLIDDKIKLACQDSLTQEIFAGLFTLNALIKLSKYFQVTHTLEQIQKYLNGIIEKQRVGISKIGNSLSIILYLINNDKINIPLSKLGTNNIVGTFNYQGRPSNNQLVQNQVITQSNQFYTQTAASNIGVTNIFQNTSPQYLNLNQNQQNYLYPNVETNLGVKGIGLDLVNAPPVIGYTTPSITQNQVNTNSVQEVMQYSQNDINSNSNFNLLNFDENKLGKLEEDTNAMRAEQEKMKNDMKKVIEEAAKLREQNEVYKTDHDSLTKENSELKNENENYKKQILAFQEENNQLRSQFTLLNKDVDAFENQNNEIRKMYEELENENNNYKKQIASYEEENNSLRNQFELLNKDIDAFENQNNEIRKMYEELENENLSYKNQIEQLNKENELLTQQIEDMKNNYTIINNEIESIKKENNLLKNSIDEQRNGGNNEEMINKLLEENNMYKLKAEENESLKKQIEELQYQLQMGQDRQEEEDEQGKEVKGDIIHDISELEMITKKINKENKKIIINLLYKASVDGDLASAFHEKCDQAENTIVLVETKNGKRFGGFTTCSWSGNCIDKSDPEAFIFSFDKMKTYDNIPGDEAIGCYPKFGPIFLGCQIKIFDNAFTKGGTTFEKELNFNTEEDYELTGGDRAFQVKDIEVYEVIIE